VLEARRKTVTTESTSVAVGLRQMRAENCFAYLIEDAETHDAALVDPRADRVVDYVRALEERGLRLRFVIARPTRTPTTCLAPPSCVRAPGPRSSSPSGRSRTSRRAGSETATD
jgi:hypothetical protein